MQARVPLPGASVWSTLKDCRVALAGSLAPGQRSIAAFSQLLKRLGRLGSLRAAAPKLELRKRPRKSPIRFIARLEPSFSEHSDDSRSAGLGEVLQRGQG